MIARRQLLALGYSRDAIAHRIRTGRLHPLFAGVYAVGRRDVTQEGLWMAAVLACGAGALLSHESAAQLWGIRPKRRGPIDISVPSPRSPRRQGIRVHRRTAIGDPRRKGGIPLTTPTQTLIDVSPALSQEQLERAINEGDRLDLVHPEQLREGTEGVRSAARLRKLLDKATFTLTDSELERLFVPIARRAGLSAPETQAEVNGLRVDFYFADLGLVVETDGGRYHRTPTQQRKDRVRDHTHAVARLTELRFTHGQVKYEPGYVEAILKALV